MKVFTRQNFEIKSNFTNNQKYLISAFFGFVLGVLLFTFFSPNYYDSDDMVKLEIVKGATLSDVIDSLYNKGIIPSKMNFRIAAFIYGAENNIKAGRYDIHNGLNYLQLLDLFKKGTPEQQKLVTISEGIWQFNLAKLLKDELNIDSAKFMELSRDREFIRSLGLSVDNLEGYLLPETYYFYADSSPEEVIRKLKTEMDKIFDDSVQTKMKELKLSRHDVLVLASIIEGESNIVGEFKRISGVYHNRLKKRIKLQADPTIQYLIRNKKRHNKIYFKDLEIDSPFNTYMYYGLPPAPLNNPGKDAILAALYPEENNFYYFVADGNGGHVFSRTLAEHQRNVRAYRQWRDEQR